MLHDIDLTYDRTGALTTPRALKVGGPLTVAGATVSAPNIPLPTDHGLTAWSYDPSFASTGQLLTNGTIYLSAVYLRAAATISKCWFLTSAAAVTPTAGQNWIGLVDSTGAVLSTANLDSVITTGSTARTATLTAAQTVSAGTYWVAIVCNAATAPTLIRTNGLTTGTNNANLTGASNRYATSLTGQTTLPASLTLSSNAVGPSLWVAVS